ncbi:Uncharacterised protein [Vibrio cholerae]|nr:Uncharacterised protein [Vibrio cholerae]CRZ94407.1 Uncharacterised protein [Vibrio cholerae]CSC40944.1 Uncharacterised protein [Vibrio cholerae]
MVTACRVVATWKLWVHFQAIRVDAGIGTRLTRTAFVPIAAIGGTFKRWQCWEVFLQADRFVTHDKAHAVSHARDWGVVHHIDAVLTARRDRFG